MKTKCGQLEFIPSLESDGSSIGKIGAIKVSKIGLNILAELA